MSVFNQHPANICVCDNNGRILFINNKLREYWGIEDGNCEGKHITEYANHPSLSAELHKRVAAGETIIRHVEHEDGAIHVVAYPVYTNGELLCTVGMFRGELVPGWEVMLMDSNKPSFLTLEQVAVDLQIDIRTLRGWAKRGYLPTVKLGKVYRINKEDYARWLGEHRTSLLDG